MKRLILTLWLFACFTFVFAQKQVVDKVLAVVGNNLILVSDIETRFLELNRGKDYEGLDLKCQIFEDLLFQNLLVNHAILDSLEVTDRDVSEQLERRIRYFVQQIGSEKKLEEYFGKTITQIKADLHESLKNQMLAEKMEMKVTGDIKVTPAEVRLYFKSVPEDSIPFIEEELELEQLVLFPHIPEEVKLMSKEKLNELRERIVSGENFATLAALYSEDVETAKRGGELGFVGRSELVPEFTAVAFNLKEGEVSRIVETDYGYHVIQLIEKRGELINVRHILISPKLPASETVKTRIRLDSIMTLVRMDTLTFSAAIEKFSDDTETKNNSGLYINPMTGNSRFTTEQLEKVDPLTAFHVKKMKVAQYSDPFEFYNETGKKGYKVIRLKSRIPAHKANLKDDYQRIQELAMEEKKHKTMMNWVEKKKKITYIQIDESYANCPFNYNWTSK
jgi:peptidyl-prolyl cis-trans isomerase SurA